MESRKRRMKRYAGIILAALVLGWGAQAGQSVSRLDELFAQLQATADLAESGRIWTAAGDKRTDAEMARGIEEMEIGDYPAALKHFDVVIEQAPGHAEGWNKRATVLYLMGDFDASKRDIARTLALEPRHWGALSGLGMIHMRSGDLLSAIEAFEDAVAINPHLLGTQLRIEQLKSIVKGSRK